MSILCGVIWFVGEDAAAAVATVVVVVAVATALAPERAFVVEVVVEAGDVMDAIDVFVGVADLSLLFVVVVTDAKTALVFALVDISKLDSDDEDELE
jgi:hypothetical protein